MKRHFSCSSGCGNGPPGVFPIRLRQSAEYKYQHGQHGYTRAAADRAAIEAELTKIEKTGRASSKSTTRPPFAKWKPMTRFRLPGRSVGDKAQDIKDMESGAFERGFVGGRD